MSIPKEYCDHPLRIHEIIHQRLTKTSAFIEPTMVDCEGSAELVSKIGSPTRCWRRFGSGSWRPLEEVCAIAFETRLRQLALFMIST